MKTHLSFATTNLDRSIAFYTALLGAAPTKKLADYALFVVEMPGLELALDLRDRVDIGADAHYGVCVETVAEVERAIARLGGLATSVERETTCCYANQTKVWAADPDGRRWEVYTVHAETDERGEANGACCVEDGGERSCCAA